MNEVNTYNDIIINLSSENTDNGRTARTITLNDHILNQVGYATFVLTNADDSKPIQWSVVGARQSELIPRVINAQTGEVAKYSNSCRVYVLPDQYNSLGAEDRVINVSAVCTETGQTSSVEVKARLTSTIKPVKAKDDFNATLSAYPQQVKIKVPAGATIGVIKPEQVMITVSVDESIRNDYIAAEIDISASGRNGSKRVDARMSVADDHTFQFDASEFLKSLVRTVDYEEVNFDIELVKFDDVTEIDHQHAYYKFLHGKIIVVRDDSIT